MLYALYGTDRQKVIVKAGELVESLKKKRPDAEIFTMNDVTYNAERVRELAHSQGLFQEKYIVVLKDVLGNKVHADSLLKLMSALAEASHVFVTVDGALLKAPVEAIKKYAKDVSQYTKPVVQKAEFNAFALADALGARDRKQAWVLYQKAVRSGATSEELAGMLFWQIKSMRLAHGATSATEAGLSPFVFSKAKRYMQKRTEAELSKLSHNLVSLYHEGHRGTIDMAIGIEQFILHI